MSKSKSKRPNSGSDLGGRIAAAARRKFGAGRGAKAALADAVGVRWQTVHNWITGQTIPRIEDLSAVAEQTGVSLDALLGVDPGEDPRFESWVLFLATPEGRALALPENAELRRCLASMPWPPGTVPTVAAYAIALAALRACVPRPT